MSWKRALLKPRPCEGGGGAAAKMTSIDHRHTERDEGGRGGVLVCICVCLHA